jgi:hypothetical protein
VRIPLARTFLIVAAVALLYEGAFNTFLLSGGLGRLLSQTPDTVLVEYASGWSVIPGFVHARNLRIRSKDGHVEFDLRIDRCSFRVALTDLLRKRFHVLHVHGTGVSFVERFRIDPGMATPERLEAIPRIEGLEAVPLKGPETPAPDDAHYNLVTVALDDVDAESVREVWVDTVRFQGDAHVVGGFFLRPIRWASVGPATAYVRSGRVTIGADVVAGDLQGRLDATVDGFDPRVTSGADVLRRTSVRIACDAGFPGLDAWRRFAPSGVEISGGAGRVHTDLRVDHGRIAPQSHVDADARGVDVRVARVSIDGALHLAADTTAGDRGASMRGVLTLAQMSIAVRGFASVPVRVDRADVTIGSSELDLVEHPLSDAEESMRLPVAQIPDARIVDAWMTDASPVHVRGGRGTFGADIDIVRGSGTGTALLALDDARLDIGPSESFAGHVRAELAIARWNVAGGQLDLSGSRVEVLGVSATGGTANWWANVKFPVSEFDLRASPVWRAHVVVEARDTRPLASAFIAAKGLPDWLTPLASADDLRVTAQVQLNAAAQALDIRDLGATAGPFRLQATISRRGDASHFIANVGAGPLQVGIESVNGDTHLELAGVDDWYEERAHPTARAERAHSTAQVTP